MTSPYGTLYHSNTGDPIGPATLDQLAASLAADAKGQNGHFLIDPDGAVIPDGTWMLTTTVSNSADAMRAQVAAAAYTRSVYVAGEPDSLPGFVPEPSWEADYVHGQCDVDDCEADATSVVTAVALLTRTQRMMPIEASVCAVHAAESLLMFSVG